MVSSINMKELKEHANYVFRNGYTCGETVVHTLNKFYDLQLPDVTIAISSGFPYGFGEGGHLCGAVAGGTIIIGAIFGRTEMSDSLPQKCRDLSRELNDYVVDHKQTVICPEYIHDYAFSTPERKDHCTEIVFAVLDAFANIMEREYGITIL